VTPTVLALRGAVTALIVSEFTTTTLVAAIPMVTVAPARNPVPEMITEVPPAVGPDEGVIDCTNSTEESWKRNPLGRVLACWSGFLTVTDAVPVACAGVVTEICVAETTFTRVPGAVSKVTVAPATKPLPLMVTTLPPAVGPDAGVTDVTTGGGSYRKAPARVLGGFARLVTVTLTAPVPLGVMQEALPWSMTDTDAAGVEPKVAVIPA
jgi:hypothetical protein